MLQHKNLLKQNWNKITGKQAGSKKGFNPLYFISAIMMKRAGYNDKKIVADILSRSYDKNIGVNYVVKGDFHRKKRIRRLMEYAFEVSYSCNEVYLSDDYKGALLCINHYHFKFNLKLLIENIKLLFYSIGVFRLFKVLKREYLIKSYHPERDYIHLWFFGVLPSCQGKGIGSRLLREYLHQCDSRNSSIYVEAAIMDNLRLYQNNGFNLFAVSKRVGFTYYFLKRESFPSPTQISRQ